MNADLSLVGTYLTETDSLDSVYKFLDDSTEFTTSCMSLALGVALSRIQAIEPINEAVFEQLTNKQKFYLLRGVVPHQEDELKAHILERFWRFTS